MTIDWRQFVPKGTYGDSGNWWEWRTPPFIGTDDQKQAWERAARRRDPYPPDSVEFWAEWLGEQMADRFGKGQQAGQSEGQGIGQGQGQIDGNEQGEGQSEPPYWERAAKRRYPYPPDSVEYWAQLLGEHAAARFRKG